MKREEFFLTVGTTTLACTIFFVIGRAIDMQWRPDLWASWAQALGAIAALPLAVLVIRIQHRRELERAELRAHEKARHCLLLLATTFGFGAKYCRTAIFNSTNENFGWGLLAQAFEDVRTRLLSVPLLDLPDHQVLLIVEKVLENIALCVALAKSRDADKKQGRTWPPETDKVFEMAASISMAGQGIARRIYQTSAMQTGANPDVQSPVEVEAAMKDLADHFAETMRGPLRPGATP